MVNANSLHGPSIDDLVWLGELHQLSKMERWQLLYQVIQREKQVREAQEKVRTDSIAYNVTSKKLAALKQQRLMIWSSIYPKQIIDRIHVGVYE